MSLVLARAGQKWLPRFGMAMLVVSGVAADLDYASYLGGPAAFLRFHRTLLHSLLGSACLAFAIAAGFCAIDRARARKRDTPATDNHAPAALPFAPALAACAVGVIAHLLLDLASGIGVQVLWPFRAGWRAWDLLTNLDPWILILLIAGLLLPELLRLVSEEIGERKKRPRGQLGAIVALIFFFAYAGVRADLHSRAISLLLSREYHGRTPLAAGAFPASSTPFRWRGVVGTEDTIEEAEVSLLPGSEFDPDRTRTLFKPEPSAALDAGQRTSAAAKYLAYARFPFAGIAESDEGYRFELRDARFPSGDSSPDNIIVVVEMSKSLQIRTEEFRYASSQSR
jgi:membrane-bound metal-dependent hydrolase YbcI (DUF457 family)